MSDSEKSDELEAEILENSVENEEPAISGENESYLQEIEKVAEIDEGIDESTSPGSADVAVIFDDDAEKNSQNYESNLVLADENAADKNEADLKDSDQSSENESPQKRSSKIDLAETEEKVDGIGEENTSSVVASPNGPRKKSLEASPPRAEMTEDVILEEEETKNVEEESVKSSENRKSPNPVASRKSSKSSPSPEKVFFQQSPSPGQSNPSSPLRGRRLSFGSDQPSAPPATPLDSPNLALLTRGSLAEIFTAESVSERSSSTGLTEETQATVQENPMSLDDDPDIPSYWILPPPGARLASRKKQPSFFIKMKMQLIADRDLKLKKEQEQKEKQQWDAELIKMKEEHFQEVWDRYGQQMDDWWTTKENGLNRKLERVKQIERCKSNRAKELSKKIYMDGIMNFEKEKEKLEKQKRQRQEVEILNTWLAHMTKN